MPRKKAADQPIPDEAAVAEQKGVTEQNNESMTDNTDTTVVGSADPEKEISELADEVTEQIPEDVFSGITGTPEGVPNGSIDTIFSKDAEDTALTPSESDSSEISSIVTPESLATRNRKAAERILTIKSKDDVMTPEDQEATIWHEIHNAYRTRRILTGTLGGIETMNDKTVAVLIYKGMRIIVPLKEMIVAKQGGMSTVEYEEYIVLQSKILNSMLGADIDFIVRGIDKNTRSVVASRREAMIRKRQLFYMTPDPSGMYRIYENRIAQARIISVTERVVFVEVFGVEAAIYAAHMSWDWIADAREQYSVGDQILVRVHSVTRGKLEDISIEVDVRSVGNKSRTEKLDKCQIQGRYAGKVIDIHNGMVFIRLSNGANAVAHSCLDRRTPGKNDDISFVVTQIDNERVQAVGIITRIIKQNI